MFLMVSKIAPVAPWGIVLANLIPRAFETRLGVVLVAEVSLHDVSKLFETSHKLLKRSFL